MKRMFRSFAAVLAVVAVSMQMGCGDGGAVRPCPGCSVSPAVVSVFPADGALNAPITTAVTVNFSCSVDPVSVTDTTVRLMAGETLVPTIATVEGARVTLTPKSSLANTTLYTGYVSVSVKSVAGAPLVRPYSWSFTTESISPPPPPPPLFTLDATRQIVNVATDEGGNVFVYGYFGSPVPDIFVAKFGADGTFGWLKEVVTPDIDWPQGGIVAQGGRVFVQRYRQATGGSGLTHVIVDAFASADGAPLWSTEVDAGSMPGGITLDAAGNVYATNSHDTVKLDSTGAIVGRTTFGGSANLFALGGLFVAGVQYVDATNLIDRYLTRSDASLVPTWTEWRRDTFEQDAIVLAYSVNDALVFVAEDSYVATPTSVTFQPYVSAYKLSGGGTTDTLAWTKSLSGGRLTAAAFAGSALYVTQDGVAPNLVKLDVSGNVTWTVPVSKGSLGLAVYNTSVFIATGGNGLSVYDAGTGAKIQ